MLILFEQHRPSHVKKSKKYLRGTDIIFLEDDPEKAKKRLSGEIEVTRGALSPGATVRKYRYLKKLQKQGKKIIGVDHHTEVISVLQEGIEEYKAGNLRYRDGESLHHLEHVADIKGMTMNMRDEVIIENIEKVLLNAKVKTAVLIMGSSHTKLYPRLKKELDKKGISVDRIFLSKGQYKDPRIHERYSPEEIVIRTAYFGLPQKRLPELFQSQKEFKSREEGIRSELSRFKSSDRQKEGAWIGALNKLKSRGGRK